MNNRKSNSTGEQATAIANRSRSAFNNINSLSNSVYIRLT